MGWRCHGRLLSEDDLATLGEADCEALCDYAGVAFRFNAETAAPHTTGRTLPGETTVVMTLRRLDRAGRMAAICLVDFAKPSRLADQEDDSMLNKAATTASRAARRHVAAELFRRAEETVARAQVA